MLDTLRRHSSSYSYPYVATGFANPHAVTGIGYTGGGTTNYVYDNNGNLTTSSGKGFEWDWRNRLKKAGAASATTTYSYDHENQRVQKVGGSATTTYVNRYYNIASTSSNATATKHIFTPGGELLATVIGTSSAATTTYLHLDHLGGTNVATDGNQATSQVLDYYPYGSQRISTGSFDEQRRFIGEHYDPESSLSYLNARYYEGSRGQFLSQDPLFLRLGTDDHSHLADPQNLNSYSYGRNNPIRFKDPGGEDFIEVGISRFWGPYYGAYSFRVDTKGIDFAYTGGGGVGSPVGGLVSARYSTGDLTHTRTVTAVREIFGADGWGWSQSYEGTFNPDCSLCIGDDASWSGGPLYGHGWGVYQGITQTVPIIRFPDIFGRTFTYDSRNGSSGSASGGFSFIPPPPGPPPPPPSSPPSSGGGGGSSAGSGTFVGGLPPPPPPPPRFF